jgi:NADH dehydrogenase FAD-containing subunit
VVGAGYTGTEVAAQGELLTARLARRMPGLAGQQIRWLLLDTAPRLLPDLDEHLSRTAARVLRRRGIEVRTGQSVAEAVHGSVKLSTGENVPTCSLIWCVGVRPDPLVDGLDLATNRERLAVDEFMSVPGAPDIYACGDCAAVPDLTRPGQVCGMTAQHAQRQASRSPETWPLLSEPGKRNRTNTTTRASWWIWAGWPLPPTRCMSRFPGRPPMPSPAAITWPPCQGTGSGSWPTGR